MISFAGVQPHGIKPSQAQLRGRLRREFPNHRAATVSLANSTQISYTDGPFVVANVTAQAGAPICTVPMSCDDFVLTVDMTGGPIPTRPNT